MKKLFIVLIFLGSLSWDSPSLADGQYIIDSKNSTIQGSIKYTVIGKYIAQFKEFSGEVGFDEKSHSVKSILLKIKVKSLKSRHPTLDKAVLSKRLLDVKRYPEIIFKSERVEKIGDSYYVTGTVNMHGVLETISFPFMMEGPLKDELNRPSLKAKGKWILNRRVFKIIWNIVLDHGGVLVGDHITVDWEITAKGGS